MSKAAAKRAFTIGSQWHFNFDGTEPKEREVGKVQTNGIAFYRNFNKTGEMSWLYFNQKTDIFKVTENKVIKTSVIEESPILVYTKITL
jgi:hypothetical protein